MTKNETVILLHGIARTSKSMKRIEKALESQGYSVLNIDYPSRKESISKLAHIVSQKINTHDLPKDQKIHFVCYSLGCIVLRELLATYTFGQVGHIVLLAPPNHGSEVADFLSNWFLYKWLYGPAGQELGTQRAKEKPFPLLDYPFGIIAGNACIDPISYFILPKEHDGKVSIESTKLAGMSDHIILPTSHTFILVNKEAIAQISYYLRHGKFLTINC